MMWISEMIITHREEPFDILSSFQNIRDSHLGLISSAKHSIELISEDARPVQSDLYRANSKVWKFTDNNIERMMKDAVN